MKDNNQVTTTEEHLEEAFEEQVRSFIWTERIQTTFFPSESCNLTRWLWPYLELGDAIHPIHKAEF